MRRMLGNHRLAASALAPRDQHQHQRQAPTSGQGHLKRHAAAQGIAVALQLADAEVFELRRLPARAPQRPSAARGKARPGRRLRGRERWAVARLRVGGWHGALLPPHL